MHEPGPSNPLRSVLEIAESALAVRHVATTVLWGPAPEEYSADAMREMAARGFDAAPVVEGQVWRYVTPELLRDNTLTVDEVAQPIGATELVTSDLGLADGVVALKGQPFRFVLSGQRVSGIFTWSDLQKPPVSMMVLAVAIAAEPALDILIESTFPNWEASLGSEARQKVSDIYDSRVRTNTEVTRITCMQIEHRLALVGKSAALRERLGYSSSKRWRQWDKRLKGIRNVLAHGGHVLEVAPDPEGAIELVQEVRRFAETAWREASEGSV